MCACHECFPAFQVFKCRMNVNFDGHRISKHPLSSSSHLKKAAEYLNIRSGDQVEVLVRQSGGWAFGICRQLNCNQATTERYLVTFSDG